MKTVRQLLTSKGRNVLSVTPDTTVYDALTILAKFHIGALLVIQKEKLLGIISERDYAREVVLKGRTSRTTSVAEVMSSKLITVSPEETVEDCMNLMSGKRVRHLPVLEGEKVVGILSIGDLVKETIEYQQFLIEQLESYIQS
ncbi:MAG: CBS domain-containing protein [Methylophilaceae bacterium]|uniref:CBS domain-containing protein n=1 Tax=Methylovorus sp. MM2 TaxID=1848038 RepID=UPI0007E11CAA|nr:CBS domain-containing protein [Methylovorus sp. MM2]OAM52241.1 histidine kinase [Methylovorus sp. MM2]